MKYPSYNIGTSGWSYKHWREIFYPEGMKPIDYLTFYSDHFYITEINTSFYHLPKPETVIGWANKVPDNFLFCPKISRYLTHMKKLIEPEKPLERFFEVFEPVKHLLGPVLVQLPPSLKFDYDRTEHFYKLLKKVYKQYDFVIEVRHATWLEQDSLTLMSKYDVGFVISQSGDRFPYSETVTAKNIYVRFHGPDPNALYASPYSDDMLNEFAKKFKLWITEGHIIWAFFNNDVGGHALTNGKKLIELMQTK
jgi:uncharacterized protein YecE (DUF72 family)